MPYIIKKVKTGFKVCKRDEPIAKGARSEVCFSKKELPLKIAKKQRIAIILSEKGIQRIKRN